MAEDKNIGERQLIRRISKILGGIVNDDCAVVDVGDRFMVATTDMLHRRSDFPDIMTPWQIGWMTVAVSLSDVAAMGALPCGVLIAAGIPPETDLCFIDSMFTGLRDCACTYGTQVLGGDMDSTEELTLTGCAFGFVEKDLIVRRSGCQPGDLLCTTGCLGGAGAGLLAWKRGDQGNKFMESLLEPRPRLKEGRALALSRSVTAMMDNSDGLALSISDLAEVSGVGFIVNEEAIPIAKGIEEMVRHDEAVDLVLKAGGDFELIFTVKPEQIDAARRACELTVIGSATEEGLWLESGGEKRRLKPEGYEHTIASSIYRSSSGTSQGQLLQCSKKSAPMERIDTLPIYQ
jgi:thiamine-monophosphate kinase